MPETSFSGLQADFSRGNSEKLCKACESINLDVLFGGRRIESDEDPPSLYEDIRVYVNNVGAILKSEGCPLCELMRFVIFEPNPVLPRENGDLICAARNCAPEPIDWSVIDCYLVPFAADLVELCGLMKSKTRERGATALWVGLVHPKDPNLFEHYIPGSGFTRSGCIEERTCFLKLNFDETNIDILQERPLLNGVKALEDRLNFELIKRWIRICETNHETCRKRETTYPAETLNAFRVVDVKARRIEQADLAGDKYAALSYVWGSDHYEYSNHLYDLGKVGSPPRSENPKWFTLPAQLPKTVEDALVFCEQIGLDYLWVDQLCIDQNDARDKAIQIKNMGHIFANAVVTIVAAAALEKRGWTYQEGLISRRCLIFGEEDCIFFCRNGFWRDSCNLGTQVESELCKDIEFPQDQSVRMHMELCNTHQYSPKFNMINYMYSVFNYAGRQFTKESDVLEAFQGYLRLIEEASETEFCFGLPKTRMLDGLCWLSPVPMKPSLLPGLPSWSWAGWRPSGSVKETGKEQDVNAAGRMRVLYPLFTRPLGRLASDELQYVVSHFRHLECQTVKIFGLIGPRQEIQTTKNQVLQCGANISFGIDGVLILESEVASFRFGIMDPVPACPFPRICLLTNDGRQIPPWCSEWDNKKASRPEDPKYASWTWAFDRPITCVMLKYWQELRRSEPYQSFKRILAMPLDDRAGTREVRRTCALFLLPVDVWDNAAPKRKTIYLA